MALVDSSDIEVSWEAAPLTAVEDCNGINVELATGERLPYGADLKYKNVTGIRISDDVTFKVPLDDTAGSDFVILAGVHKAKSVGTLKVKYGSTYYRSLEMVCTRCNPIPVGGEVVMVEITLVNNTATLTEN